jgi:hypothetical protein
MKPGENYSGVSQSSVSDILGRTILANAIFVVESSQLIPAA